ncbi:MAG: flavin-containing monooxygenase [Panacagrimonas sp.]
MADSSEAATVQFDAVVIGAGVSGMHFIHLARQRGWSVQAFEAGSGVGGTWYWNRYPGCRVDVESLEYSYSFSEELQQEWEWSERYAGQPELERYCNHVADRFGLRPYVRFDTRVTSAHFDEKRERWTVCTNTGAVVSARYLISATGTLSDPVLPKFEGLDQFQGLKLQTSLWPRERPALAGKRVAVIGTGASGVQVIQTLAPTVGHLSVLQRTAAHTVPLRNHPMDPAHQRAMKSRYGELRKALAASFAGLTTLHSQIEAPPTRSALEVSDEERRRVFEDRWASGGLCIYNAFTDLLLDERANAELESFYRDKLAQRVAKPGIADKLTPRGHPVLTRRLAGDSGYVEAFDRDNVDLVDLQEEPIRRFTPGGIVVGVREIPLDAVIFATGFDVGIGAIARIDLRGRNGRSLQEAWAQGFKTHLAMTMDGFPNLFCINGAGVPFYNPMLMCEFQGNWIMRCIDQLERRGARTMEPTTEAVETWTRFHDSITDMTLFPKGRNYYMGDNIPGKTRRSAFFWGGWPLYVKQCEAALADNDCLRYDGKAIRARLDAGY